MKALAAIVVVIVVAVKIACGMFDAASDQVQYKAETRLAQIDKVTEGK